MALRLSGTKCRRACRSRSRLTATKATIVLATVVAHKIASVYVSFSTWAPTVVRSAGNDKAEEWR